MPRLTVCLLTSPGRGAVASIEVKGRDAVSVVQPLFSPADGKSILNKPIGKVVFGLWRSSAEGPVEELVVCRKSEDIVEIHCHGGDAASHAIINSLVSAGCTKIAWQDSILSNQPRLVAEANIALAKCTTEVASRHLLAQAGGALEDWAQSASRHLSENGKGNVTTEIREDLRIILENAEFGLHLSEPWKVVLCGKPNVGKSSLINQMVGYERSIVYNQPGTTRDVLSVRAAIHGLAVELSDTAGLRQIDEEIESEGVSRALAQIDEADLLIWVCDAREASDWNHNGIDSFDAIVPSPAQPKSTSPLDSRAMNQRSTILVLNKYDLVSNEQSDHTLTRITSELNSPQVVPTVAKDGKGTRELIDAIHQELVPNAIAVGTPLIVCRRQHELLLGLNEAIHLDDSETPLNILQQLIAG